MRTRPSGCWSRTCCCWASRLPSAASCSGAGATGKGRSGSSGTPSPPAWPCGSSGRSVSRSPTLTSDARWVQWHTMFSLCGGIGAAGGALRASVPRRRASHRRGRRRRPRQLRAAARFPLRLFRHGAERGAGDRTVAPGDAARAGAVAAAACWRSASPLASGSRATPRGAAPTSRWPSARPRVLPADGHQRRDCQPPLSRRQRLRPRVDRAVLLLCVGRARRADVAPTASSSDRRAGRWQTAVVSAVPVFLIPLIGFGLLQCSRSASRATRCGCC